MIHFTDYIVAVVILVVGIAILHRGQNVDANTTGRQYLCFVAKIVALFLLLWYICNGGYYGVIH